MKGIPNIKPPGNDGLTKEFYETFRDELKDSFINSIKLAYQKNALSTSQRQDLKKNSNAFASRLKTVLPSIISWE